MVKQCYSPRQFHSLRQIASEWSRPAPVVSSLRLAFRVRHLPRKSSNRFCRRGKTHAIPRLHPIWPAESCPPWRSLGSRVHLRVLDNALFVRVLKSSTCSQMRHRQRVNFLDDRVFGNKPFMATSTRQRNRSKPCAISRFGISRPLRPTTFSVVRRGQCLRR